MVAPKKDQTQDLVAPKKDRTQDLVARWSKAPIGRTMVKKTDS